MKYDVLKKQGKRTDLTCGTEFHKSEPENKKARDTVGKEAGISGRQVQKYISLTELIPPLLDIVDAKKIGLNMAVDISHFDRELQNWIYE